MSFIKVEMKGVTKAFERMKKVTKVATYRSLNQLSIKALREASKIIRQEYPIRLKDINRAVVKKNAHSNRLYVSWYIKSQRPKLVNPRQLKSGVTFKGLGNERKKLSEQIRGGSKPFVIIASNSRKKLAVFRRRNSNKKVSALQHSSVAFMFKKTQIEEKFLRNYIRNNFDEIFSKQLVRAKRFP